jgi:hypothetical protein
MRGKPREAGAEAFDILLAPIYADNLASFLQEELREGTDATSDVEYGFAREGKFERCQMGQSGFVNGAIFRRVKDLHPFTW